MQTMRSSSILALIALRSSVLMAAFSSSLSWSMMIFFVSGSSMCTAFLLLTGVGLTGVATLRSLAPVGPSSSSSSCGSRRSRTGLPMSYCSACIWMSSLALGISCAS